jgi:hypothetical protein
MSDETIALWRPVDPKQLELIERAEMRRFRTRTLASRTRRLDPVLGAFGNEAPVEVGDGAEHVEIVSLLLEMRPVRVFSEMAAVDTTIGSRPTRQRTGHDQGFTDTMFRGRVCRLPWRTIWGTFHNGPDKAFLGWVKKVTKGLRCFGISQWISRCSGSG